MSNGRYRGRLILTAAVTIAVLIGLSLRLVLLHVGPHEKLKTRVDRMRYTEKEIRVGRGRIFDAQGSILALDLPVQDVFADPKVILEKGHLQFVTSHLARILQLDAEELYGRLNRPEKRFVYVKRFVPQDTADRIAGLRLSGVHFIQGTARHYPHGTLMAHVLGFSNWEGVGSAGIEQAFDHYLRGRAGFRISRRDGRRRELYSERSLEIAPQSGADVYLTLDQNIQYIVEEALDKALEEHQAEGMWAIVQRIRTGEILALAARPHYNLNAFRFTTAHERLNRSIGYLYEPGSTFKVMVLAAALNEKAVHPDQIIDCEQGHWIYKRRPLRDFHPYGRLTVRDVLKKSSNIGAAKVALALGEKRLAEYLAAFGFGRRTDINLPGEEAGIFHDLSKWSSISATRLAMGHEIAVTSLQVLNAVSAIANEGFLMKPFVVKKVVDVQGRVLLNTEPEVLSRPIEADTARLMRGLMTRVTEQGGTGKRARVAGYSVAGKTGTAQKPIPGGYSDRDNMASFVGFLPAEEPELAIIVVADAPQPFHTGGRVAAPVFQEIADQTVRYLGVPPVGIMGRRASPVLPGADI